MGRLNGKVAIITGAARGMGAAHARKFVAEGAKVAITDILVEEGQNLADELGQNAIFVQHDVTKEEDWQNVVSKTEAAFGPINVLVNNAGVATTVPFETGTVEMYRQVFEVNELSVFIGIKTVLPSMKEAKGGSIVNISSISGIVGQVGASAYGGTKFAVRGISKVAALELAPYGIRANSVHPGLVRTPMIDIPEHQEILNEMAKDIPLGRIGKPEELTSLCLFLASDESGYCTGSEFVADGGFIAK